MKLYYYKDPIGNFGDDLNSWLWPRLLGTILDDDEDRLFVGIGTILTESLPSKPFKTVFGSGASGRRPPPLIDEKCEFVCVRGPLTANFLGLPPSMSVIDPAVLVRLLFSPRKQGDSVGYMPHHHSSHLEDWRAVCDRAGFIYIDPTCDVDTILGLIGNCRLLFAEAMHGAIVADALGIAWVPVVSGEHILEFKWRDWCMSVGVPYAPLRVFPIWRLGSAASLLSRAVHLVKRECLARKMCRVASGRERGIVQLSARSVIDQKTGELLKRLEAVKKRYRKL